MLIESRAGWQVVAEAGTGREAMALAGSQRPDIVLLDLALDQENGVELIAPLLEAAAGAKVIVLTGLRDPSVHQEAVSRGALGVVMKDRASEVLLKAIVLPRGGFVSSHNCCQSPS